MATIRGPQKGKAEDLAISDGAGRRFMVGLSWNPQEPPKLDLSLPPVPRGDAVSAGAWFILLPFRLVRLAFRRLFRGLLTAGSSVSYQKDAVKPDDAVGRDDTSHSHDLDLLCYVFDAELRLLHAIGPENGNYIDPSRKVYHSGEDHAGFGGPDDETVSVETKDLPAAYCHFFFVVKSDTRYALHDMRNPFIRLADGMTNENALENTIDPPAHYNASAYVFCHVWLDGENWRFRNLDEYSGFDAAWETLLPSFVRPGAAQERPACPG